jgi:hypothetical protein
MSAKTTTRVLDKRGVRLVVGQNVTLEEPGKFGQLMGITDLGLCLVRLSNSSDIVTVKANSVSVATWEQVRGQDKANNEKPRLF